MSSICAANVLFVPLIRSCVVAAQSYPTSMLVLDYVSPKLLLSAKFLLNKWNYWIRWLTYFLCNRNLTLGYQFLASRRSGTRLGLHCQDFPKGSKSKQCVLEGYMTRRVVLLASGDSILESGRGPRDGWRLCRQDTPQSESAAFDKQVSLLQLYSSNGSWKQDDKEWECASSSHLHIHWDYELRITWAINYVIVPVSFFLLS